ncbi:hypothetical protein CTI14_57300 [Methylobacterium radiotolerans]|nr:hypothetical protein CTI14_57300 [Methylobacterium radiotolerans]
MLALVMALVMAWVLGARGPSGRPQASSPVGAEQVDDRPEHVRPQGDQQAGGTQHDDREERDRMLVEAFHGRGEPWCWPW